MSQETMYWLNTMTLQSRAVWHTDQKIQQLLDKPTVYDGPIPVADVRSRLFHWQPLELDFTAHGVLMNEDGVEDVSIPATTLKAICRPPRALSPDDPGAVLQTAKLAYEARAYGKLVDDVEAILDQGLHVFSAGLLREGAVGWIQVSMPDDVTTPQGVTARPYLLAATSLDKTLSNTYKAGFREAVCDNTLSGALLENSPTYRIRHSKGSDLKIMEAREALEIIHTMADDFQAAVANLCATTVTDAEFDRFLEEIKPTRDKDGLKTGAAATRAKNAQDEFRSLWRSDPRVEPWKNTAFGVLQCVNTHANHIADVRGDRDERNMEHDLFGKFDKLDRNTLDTLNGVLCAA